MAACHRGTWQLPPPPTPKKVTKHLFFYNKLVSFFCEKKGKCRSVKYDKIFRYMMASFLLSHESFKFTNFLCHVISRSFRNLIFCRKIDQNDNCFNPTSLRFCFNLINRTHHSSICTVFHNTETIRYVKNSINISFRKL